MKSAIEELYYGKLGGREVSAEKEREATAEASDKGKALYNLIKDNEEAVKAYFEYCDAYNYNLCVQIFENYKDGFRNGFWLAFDVMKEE